MTASVKEMGSEEGTASEGDLRKDQAHTTNSPGSFPRPTFQREGRAPEIDEPMDLQSQPQGAWPATMAIAAGTAKV